MPDLQSRLDKEREKSDQAYAIKLIEKIVYGCIVIFFTAVVGALVTLFFNHFK